MIVRAVVGVLGECRAREGRCPPLVVDPMMVATSGDALLRPDAVALYAEHRFPLATVVTPNLDEVRPRLCLDPRQRALFLTG